MDFFEFDNEDFDEINELIQQFEDAIKRNNSAFFDQDDFESIIDYYEDIGQFEKALVANERALEIHPFSATLLLRQAHLIFNLKNAESALEIIDKVISLDASEIGAYILKAEIYSFQSKYNEAIEILQHLENLCEGDDLIDVYLQTCDVYEDMSKHQLVFEYLKKCLRLDASNDEAINRINYCLELTQNFEDGIEFFRELINKQPYNHQAWYNLACAYRGLGLTEKAIEAFEYVIAINEDIDYVYIDLAELLLKENQFEKALDVLNDLSENYEPDEEVFVLQGKCFDAQNNYKMARYYYKKALHQNPSLSDVYFKIGETYKKEDLWEQAFQAFQKAADLEKEQYEFCLALAEAALEINELDVAIDACETAIEIFVNKEDGYFLMSKVFSTINDLETAEKIVMNGISLCKETRKLEYALVAVYLMQLKNKEAEIKLKKLVSEDGSKNIDFIYLYNDELDDNAIINSVLLSNN